MQFENDRLDFPENMINLADFFQIKWRKSGKLF